MDTPRPRNRPMPMPLSPLDTMTPQMQIIEGPWWLKAAYVFGIPAVIAGALVWMLAVRVDGNMVNIKESQARQEFNQTQQAKQLETIGGSLDRLERILEQICVNGATTVQDRSLCFK